MSRRTLLGVWAHPDDEAYLSAGLMREFARRGDRVVVVTATAGEHGTVDPLAWPPHRLAALRRRELAAAVAAVGVDEHLLLGYADGACDRVDGTAAIAHQIVRVRPDVIVTFGPDGMTGHPDHRAVSRWTTAAWAAAGAPGELWYATLTSGFHAEWGSTNDELGIWVDQPDPPCAEPDELSHLGELDDDALDVKLAALRAHASQTRPLEAALGTERFRTWWRTEAFRAARVPAGVGGRP